MARLAVFASGNGSNFEALAEGLEGTRHVVAGLVADRKDAFALKRAEKLGIPSFFISYKNRSREEAETEIVTLLKTLGVDLIALAGFMRLLSPLLIDAFPGRIINIHPSLLPKYPGKHGILESFESGDAKLGITIHYVDYGLDSGPIILQESFTRSEGDSLDTVEERIHSLEHLHYPEVVKRLLDSTDR